MQLAGATCELTTDDVTKYDGTIVSNTSHSSISRTTNLKWISAAIQELGYNQYTYCYLVRSINSQSNNSCLLQQHWCPGFLLPSSSPLVF